MTTPGGINKYHQLLTVKVRPSQLVLDPSNPRINVDVEADRKYSNAEIVSDAVQIEILNKINMDEYRVAELKRGIERNGFLSGTGPIIVEKVDGTEKYIVLEGNRRTTAIKSILKEPKKQPESVLKTLELIEVKEFKYVENAFFDKDEIIDILLGTIHITGPVAWGAMEKAYYIYKTYQRELEKSAIRSGFHINTDVVKKLAGIFNCNNSEITKSLRVYRVYQQLKANEYKLDSKKFTLIEIAVANKDMRSKYFCMDSTCHFSDQGMERFNVLCLEPNAPISNPQSFNQFKYIFRNGEEKNISEIENGISDIETVYNRVKENKHESHILDQLKEIHSKLLSLNVVGFAGDEEEKHVVDSIARVVNHKLVKIFEDEESEEQEYGDWYYPESVDELLNIESWKIQEIIKDTLRNRPNNTCVKEKLPTLALKQLEIITSGQPRERVIHYMTKELETMIENGLVKDYLGGKNQRVRLLVD